jgi:hypothetical protein
MHFSLGRSIILRQRPPAIKRPRFTGYVTQV